VANTKGAVMSESRSKTTGRGTKLLDRLVESVPVQYRREVTRVANTIRDKLPPIMVEHRIDAFERHVDERLSQIEAKIDEVLQRLTKPSA